MNKNLDILMVFPSGGNVFYNHFNYHLGSAYIIAYLRKHGFEAEQFISSTSYNVKECVKKILTFNPKIVGFTVYETNYMQCVLISNSLKSVNSDLIIIFGGPTPTIQAKEILESIESVNLCVRQEGEETLLEFLNDLSKTNFDLNQTALNKIKGITFKNRNGIIKNPDSNILLSNKTTKNYLDKYPSPYLSNVIPASRAYPIGILTARGCNQNCIYCNCAVLSRKNIYFHSINRVIEELTYLNEYKKFLGPVPIYDDAFTLIPSRAKRICEEIVENSIKIPLLCTTRCDKLTTDLLDLMMQAGFHSIGFSLESAVPKVLRAIGKINHPNKVSSDNFTKEIEFIKKFEEMVLYAKNIGIPRIFASIMVGLPGESLQDAQKTINLIKKLDIDVYTHNFLHIFKGTPIYQNYRRYGYKIKPISEKNQIILKNDFPFNVYQVELGEKSTRISKGIIKDYNTLKILSLNLKRATQKPFFNNIIINSDVIKPSLVHWMQGNLALNGIIIQIYSNEKNLLKFHDKNRSILYDNFAPSCCYEGYYREYFDGHISLGSERMALFGKEIGISINIENTYLALKNYKKSKHNMLYTICHDKTKNDTVALLKFLNQVLKYKDPYEYLLNRTPLPQFPDLCRWTSEQTNCHKLETAIIEHDDSIRICWHSDPIGKIGTPFTNIKIKLQNLKEKIIKARNCKGCYQTDSCPKCFFPSPLSSKEYCNYYRSYDTWKPAEIINNLSVANDFFYKPINYLDY